MLTSVPTEVLVLLCLAIPACLAGPVWVRHRRMRQGRWDVFRLELERAGFLFRPGAKPHGFAAEGVIDGVRIVVETIVVGAGRSARGVTVLRTGGWDATNRVKVVPHVVARLGGIDTSGEVQLAPPFAASHRAFASNPRIPWLTEPVQRALSELGGMPSLELSPAGFTMTIEGFVSSGGPLVRAAELVSAMATGRAPAPAAPSFDAWRLHWNDDWSLALVAPWIPAMLASFFGSHLPLLRHLLEVLACPPGTRLVASESLDARCLRFGDAEGLDVTPRTMALGFAIAATTLLVGLGIRALVRAPRQELANAARSAGPYR